MAEITKPLRELLSPKNDWVWGAPQQKAFEDLKSELSDPNKLLAHYNLTAKTVLSADASSYGLWAVITQLKKMVILIVILNSHSNVKKP